MSHKPYHAGGPVAMTRPPQPPPAPQQQPYSPARYAYTQRPAYGSAAEHEEEYASTDDEHEEESPAAAAPMYAHHSLRHERVPVADPPFAAHPYRPPPGAGTVPLSSTSTSQRKPPPPPLSAQRSEPPPTAARPIPVPVPQRSQTQSAQSGSPGRTGNVYPFFHAGCFEIFQTVCALMGRESWVHAERVLWAVIRRQNLEDPAISGINGVIYGKEVDNTQGIESVEPLANLELAGFDSLPDQVVRFLALDKPRPVPLSVYLSWWCGPAALWIFKWPDIFPVKEAYSNPFHMKPLPPSVAGASPLERLPVELLASIIEEFDGFPDLASLLSVSKTIRHLCMNSMDTFVRKLAPECLAPPLYLLHHLKQDPQCPPGPFPWLRYVHWLQILQPVDAQPLAHLWRVRADCRYCEGDERRGARAARAAHRDGNGRRVNAAPTPAPAALYFAAGYSYQSVLHPHIFSPSLLLSSFLIAFSSGLSRSTHLSPLVLSSHSTLACSPLVSTSSFTLHISCSHLPLPLPVAFSAILCRRSSSSHFPTFLLSRTLGTDTQSRSYEYPHAFRLIDTHSCITHTRSTLPRRPHSLAVYTATLHALYCFICSHSLTPLPVSRSCTGSCPTRALLVALTFHIVSCRCTFSRSFHRPLLTSRYLF